MLLLGAKECRRDRVGILGEVAENTAAILQQLLKENEERLTGGARQVCHNFARLLQQ